MLVAEGHVSVGGVVEHRKTAKIRAGQIVDIGDLRIWCATATAMATATTPTTRPDPPLPPTEPDPP